MFLPTTQAELAKLGWDQLDVILITGDTYIDSPYIGAAVIGKVLSHAGYRVGIIAQPDLETATDISRLGEPLLFWGVTSGSVDSMVANYTATKKRRRQDDFTPGGVNNQRPDRAVIAYANLIRHYFKNTKPIVLGGIEASLRRIAHYDFWNDSLRKSILIDAKADFLAYGMAEKSILELAAKLRQGQETHSIRGICYLAKEPCPEYLLLPSFAAVKNDKLKFIEMFHLFYHNNDPLTARGLCQQQESRFLIQNPPADNLTESELSAIHDLDYERDVHPYYKKEGPVRALDTIRFSQTTHRGCYGECNFCSIAVHQGRTIQNRTLHSILEETKKITKLPDFKGYILDVGGPTANMYKMDCENKLQKGSCQNKRCLYPDICKNLKPNHQEQIRLLQQLRQIPGVKKVFVASGLRYDLILGDERSGLSYLKEVVEHHISGQLKIAPEHVEDKVLAKMGKPAAIKLQEFKELFDRLNQQAGKKQFLTYYLIAAHPGCEYEDMARLKSFAARELRISPEQVQIFTPLPSTYSALMYYTGLDPFTLKPIFVEKDLLRKEKQKQVVVGAERLGRAFRP